MANLHDILSDTDSSQVHLILSIGVNIDRCQYIPNRLAPCCFSHSQTTVPYSQWWDYRKSEHLTKSCSKCGLQCHHYPSGCCMNRQRQSYWYIISILSKCIGIQGLTLYLCDASKSYVAFCCCDVQEQQWQGMSASQVPISRQKLFSFCVSKTSVR